MGFLANIFILSRLGLGMGTGRRIYKNTVYLGIAEVVSRVLQFVVMLYAARLLSQGNFGRVSFALSLSFIAVILADLGINTLLIREISRNKDLASKFFINAFSAKIALSIFAFFIIFGTLNLLGYPAGTRQIVYIIWLFTIISTFTELFYSIFRALEMMFYDAMLKILRMVILAAASLYILFQGYGVVVFSYAFVFTEAVVVLAAFAIASAKFIRLGFDVDIPFIISLVKKSLPFGLAIVFGGVYFYIGSVILSKIGGDAEVAVFSAAYNIALALLFVPAVYTNAIYPVLSRYYQESRAELKLLYERPFKYLYIIGIPISVGIYMLAKRIILLLYGPEYAASSIALQIIAIYLFLKFINFLLGIVLSSIDRQNKRMLGQGLTAAFSVLLNIILIPLIGFAGAALSTLITEVFLFMIYYIFVSKSWYFYNFTKVLLKPAAAAVIMGAFIKYTGFGLTATIILSAIIYITSIFALKTFDSQDYKIMRTILKNENV